MLLIFVSLVACQAKPATNPTAVPTPVPLLATAVPPTATSVPPTVIPLPTLTMDQVMNATYIAPQYNKTVTLVNGKFESGSGVDYLQVEILPQVAFGDLDEDGDDDSVLLLAENGGGSGVFVSLIVLINQDGNPLQSAYMLIDDRPQIEDLSITDGKIQLATAVHWINDPMCCPTKKIFGYWAYTNHALRAVHFTSQLPGGAERAIHITSPIDGAQVSGSVLVVGNMPVAPFENTLAYHIYDNSGTQLAEGAFMVNSADMGAPATFSNTFDLPSLSVGTVVWLELREVSMADGSTIALEAVKLEIK